MEFLLLPLLLVLIAIGLPIGYALIAAGIVVLIQRSERTDPQ